MYHLESFYFFIKNMDNSVGERIKIIRGAESQKDFGARFGVNLNTIGRYEAGGNLGSDFIIALCKERNINPSWLLFGEGSMRKDQRPEIDVISKNDESIIGRDEFDLIPMVETKLSAGGGSFVVSEKINGYYAFRKSWVRRIATSAKGLYLMTVIGDSMATTLQPGDNVMIDVNRRDITEGEIYAIRFDSTVMIKRLTFRPGNKIRIISDNRTEYDPYDVEIKDLHVLGQMIFYSRVLIRNQLQGE